MNSGLVIGIVVAVLLIVALIGPGPCWRGAARSRSPRTNRQPSRSTVPPDGTGRQVDRSGGYKTGSGFSFSQGSTALAEPPKPREPETVAKAPHSPRPRTARGPAQPEGRHRAGDRRGAGGHREAGGDRRA